MRVKPNPFVITFDREADGGPHHLLSLLVEYNVQLYKRGRLLAEGAIGEVGPEFIVIYEFNEQSGLFDGAGRIFCWFDGTFDEVRYM